MSVLWSLQLQRGNISKEGQVCRLASPFALTCSLFQPQNKIPCAVHSLKILLTAAESQTLYRTLLMAGPSHHIDLSSFNFQGWSDVGSDSGKIADCSEPDQNGIESYCIRHHPTQGFLGVLRMSSASDLRSKPFFAVLNCVTSDNSVLDMVGNS